VSSGKLSLAFYETFVGLLRIYEFLQKERDMEYSKMKSGNMENYRRNGIANISYFKESIMRCIYYYGNGEIFMHEVVSY
jgi:hypothetical protein